VRFWGGVGLKRRFRKFLIHDVLRADDTPHRIALGAGVGTFVGLTPTIPIQMLLALGLATLFRANKIVAMAFVWITNPVTLWPLYWICWVVGHTILNWGQVADPEIVHFQQRFQQMADSGSHVGLLDAEFWTRFFNTSFWVDLANSLMSMGADLMVGGLVVGTILGVAVYTFLRWLIGAYREKRRQRVILRQLARESRRARRKSRGIRASSDTV
jgi:uncharacterized protein (DUF2062 family)